MGYRLRSYKLHQTADITGHDRPGGPLKLARPSTRTPGVTRVPCFPPLHPSCRASWRAVSTILPGCNRPHHAGGYEFAPRPKPARTGPESLVFAFSGLRFPTNYPDPGRRSPANPAPLCPWLICVCPFGASNRMPRP